MGEHGQNAPKGLPGWIFRPETHFFEFIAFFLLFFASIFFQLAQTFQPVSWSFLAAVPEKKVCETGLISCGFAMVIPA